MVICGADRRGSGIGAEGAGSMRLRRLMLGTAVGAGALVAFAWLPAGWRWAARGSWRAGRRLGLLRRAGDQLRG
jgi:hypothetical protein